MQSSLCQKNLDAFCQLLSGEPETLLAVHKHEVDSCVSALTLVFATKVLELSANAEDDTLAVSCRSVGTNETRQANDSSFPFLPWFIGKEFGWAWVTVNQQGYCDGALLSFGGITPQVVINVAASSIEVAVIGT